MIHISALGHGFYSSIAKNFTKPTKTVKIIQKFTVRPGGSHHRPLPNRPLLTTLLSARLQRSSAIVLFSAECVCLKTLLLSRRSRQRLSASELSLCLSVCRQNAKKAIFSKTKQFRAMVSIYDL